LLQSLLSAAEQRRIEPLRRDATVTASLLGRGALRWWLGGLDPAKEPRQLPLTVGPGGQPPAGRSGFSASSTFPLRRPGACWPFTPLPRRWLIVERRESGLSSLATDRASLLRPRRSAAESRRLPPSKQRLAFPEALVPLEATLNGRQGTGILAPGPLPSSASHRPPNELQLPEGYAVAVAMVLRCAFWP